MRNRDRFFGAYLGAAIGDAMGGPVEGQHAARIKRVYGEIKGFLPYQSPPGLCHLHPGGALHPKPGSVTDDTYIRADLTQFYLDTKPPRTPQLLVDWLLKHGNFDRWSQRRTWVLYRIRRGELRAEDAGLTNPQGGGLGWWTPVGLIHAGDPRKAVVEVRNLSRIWKAPLEQDLLSGVQAGLAEALSKYASIESVIDAILEPCGRLARKLIERAVDIGYKSKDFDDLVDKLYHNCLVDEAPTEFDAPLPPPVEPVDDTDEMYISNLYAEQVPLSVAAFVFSKGDPQHAIPWASMIGRDADTIATTVGSWVGALHGESRLPKHWVDQVCKANLREIDIRDLAKKLWSLPRV